MKSASSKIYKLGKTEAASPLILNQVKPFPGGMGGVFTVEREAYERGFTAGENAGMQMGQEKVNNIIKRLSSVVQEIVEIKERFYIEKEKEVVGLVMAVARKVIHAELSINRDVIVKVVNAAISAITASGGFVIKINPSDMEYIQQNKPDILQEWGNKREARVMADPAIEKGGCIAENSQAEVDARIEEGLKAVEAIMREELEK